MARKKLTALGVPLVPARQVRVAIGSWARNEPRRIGHEPLAVFDGVLVHAARCPRAAWQCDPRPARRTGLVSDE